MACEELIRKGQFAAILESFCWDESATLAHRSTVTPFWVIPWVPSQMNAFKRQKRKVSGAGRRGSFGFVCTLSIVVGDILANIYQGMI
jgi:hypothetical protein